MFLSGWKQIAERLGVTPQTAKMYHKRYGMPILRLPGGKPITWDELIQHWLVDTGPKTKYTSVMSK